MILLSQFCQYKAVSKKRIRTHKIIIAGLVCALIAVVAGLAYLVTTDSEVTELDIDGQ